MKIKFMHLSDLHMDMPFSSLNRFDGAAKQRRLEQKVYLKKAFDIAKERDVDLILIAGDLFEHQYVTMTTIAFINECFASVPDIPIFISPGNHDPYIKNSFYCTHQWPSNVHIFSGELEKIYLENLNTCIYGAGFNDFLLHSSKVSSLRIEDSEKINILITHGTLDNLSGPAGYHTISASQLQNSALDYIALGHIHKPQFGMTGGKSFYPGSMIALGFDEPGEHGVIIGELGKGHLDYDFVCIDNKKFTTLEINADGCETVQMIVDKIIARCDSELIKDSYCRIYISGLVRAEVLEQTELIEKLVVESIGNGNFLFFFNLTPEYDFNSLMEGNDLKALYVKSLMNQIESEGDEAEKKRLIKALHIGLSALEGRKVYLV